MIGANASQISFSLSFDLNFFIVENSTIPFVILVILASHSPFWLNNEKLFPIFILSYRHILLSIIRVPTAVSAGPGTAIINSEPDLSNKYRLTSGLR